MGLKSVVRNSRLLMRMAVPIHRSFLTAMAKRPIKGPIPDFSNAPMLRIGRYSSKEEYDVSPDGSSEVLAQRRGREAELAAGRSKFALRGYCAICGDNTEFRITSDFTPGVPNWRETTFCGSCGLSSRMRYALHVLWHQFPPSARDDVYIAEVFTRSYRWMKGRLPFLIGSEYLDGGIPGELVSGVRHEDMQKLSFPEGSLDYVLSFEVMEHVPDLSRATKEMARVLRPGGRAYFTAPFRLDAKETIVRATMAANGDVTHHVPPEIHGNPTNPGGGALCYRHFGWSYLNDLRAAGFRETEVITFWSEPLGYFTTPAIITAVKGYS
jgi:SAM-dependent methyltransferase